MADAFYRDEYGPGGPPPTEESTLDRAPDLGPDEFIPPESQRVPVVDANVLSVFDARPIFAEDFVATGFRDNFDAGPTSSFVVTFVVPPGFRAILRRLSWSIGVVNPATGGGGLYDVFGNVSNNAGAPRPPTLTIDVNGSAVRGFRQVQIEPFGIDQTVYVLADEGQAINVTFAIAVGQIGGMEIQMEGNLLQTTHRPLEFEPGAKRPYPVFIRAEEGGGAA